MTSQAKSRYFAFSLFLFFLTGFFAFAVSYMPIYGKWIGFTPFQLAMLGIVWSGSNIFGPPMVMHTAHHWLSAKTLLRVLYFILFMTVPLIYLSNQFTFIIVIWAVLIVLLRGGYTLVEAQIVQDANRKKLILEHTRVWGSIGFVVFVFALGWLFDHYQEPVILPVGIINALLIFIGAWLASKYLYSEVKSLSTKKEELGRKESTFKKGGVVFWILLITVMLVNIGHAPYYVYFSVYLRSLNHSGLFISTAWNIGVFAEILFFVIVPRYRDRISLSSLLRISIAGSILRWFLLFLSKDPAIILLSQTLHALSFGGVYIASIELTFKILPKSYRDRGQGLRAAVGYGLGAMVGSFLAGFSAERIASLQDVNYIFGGAAAVTFLALILSFWISDNYQTSDEEF